MIYIRINLIYGIRYIKLWMISEKAFHISYIAYKYFSTIPDILLDIRDIPFFIKRRVYLFSNIMYHISYISEEIYNISNQMPCMCQRYINYVSVSILYTLSFYQMRYRS